MGLPKHTVAWDLYIDGRGMGGVASEVKLPKLEREMEAYRGGGMIGGVKLDMGIKELELEFTLGQYDGNVLKSWGVQDAGGIQIRLMLAAVSGDGGRVDAQEVSARGRWESLDLGQVKGKELTKLQVKMPLVYYKWTVNGQVLNEIDMINGKDVVNGKDRMAEVRKAIGRA